MLQPELAAREFLDSMKPEDKQKLFNHLLGLNATHQVNAETSFYSYRGFKKWLHPHKREAVQAFSFKNEHNDELVIKQLKEHNFLKQHYRIEIFYNLVEYDYHLVDDLLTELKTEYLSYA